MRSLLLRPVMSELAARRLGWTAGYMLLSACTALVLKMLPEFGPLGSIGLVAATALAWVVLGSQLPKVMRT